MGPTQSLGQCLHVCGSKVPGRVVLRGGWGLYGGGQECWWTLIRVDNLGNFQVQVEPVIKTHAPCHRWHRFNFENFLIFYSPWWWARLPQLDQYLELDFASLKFWTRLHIVQDSRLSVKPLGFDLASTSSSSTSIISHIYLNLLMSILTTWTDQLFLVSYPSLLLFPLTLWLASSRL